MTDPKTVLINSLKELHVRLQCAVTDLPAATSPEALAMTLMPVYGPAPGLASVIENLAPSVLDALDHAWEAAKVGSMPTVQVQLAIAAVHCMYAVEQLRGYADPPVAPAPD